MIAAADGLSRTVRHRAGQDRSPVSRDVRHTSVAGSLLELRRVRGEHESGWHRGSVFPYRHLAVSGGQNVRMCLVRRDSPLTELLALSGAFCALAMSHAWTGWQTDIESSLSNERLTAWTHTANAATVRERSSRTCRHGS